MVLPGCPTLDGTRCHGETSFEFFIPIEACTAPDIALVVDKANPFKRGVHAIAIQVACGTNGKSRAGACALRFVGVLVKERIVDREVQCLPG